MDEQRRQWREVYKLAFEVYKHLTTLSAGSIVIIGTFLRDIFPSKNGVLEVGAGIKFLITLSFLLFGISLIASVLLLNWLSNEITYTFGEQYERETSYIDSLIQSLPTLCFTTGIFGFGLAVVLNLYR